MATQTQNEAPVRKLIDGWLEAIRKKDLERVMSFYSKDVVAYDLMPPLKYEGAQQYQKAWEMGFTMTEGPFDIELKDLSITAGEDVAFAHALEHVSVKTKETKEKMEMWTRCTLGFKRTNSGWKIVHEQDSVPIDMETNKALIDMKP